MNKENICSFCKTGKETYELDNTSVCPYLLLNDGNHCSMFVELDEDTDTGSFLKNSIQ